MSSSCETPDLLTVIEGDEGEHFRCGLSTEECRVVHGNFSLHHA